MTVLTVTLNPCIDKTCSVERVAPDRKVGGLLVALEQGRSRRESAAFGVAAGAAAVMTEGTVLCRREDAERLYERMRKAAGNR